MSAIKREERIGGQRLILGDCLEVMKELESVDAVVTDPPYGVGDGVGSKARAGGHKARKEKTKYKCFEDTRKYIMEVVIPAIEAARKISERTILTCGVKNMFCYPEPKHVGSFQYSGSTVMSSWGPMLWQPILFYGKDPYPQTMKPDSFQNCNGSERGVDHPCPKPYKQWAALMQRVTRPNETILDPFMGSGTTLVACQKLGRQGIGIELDPDYFEIACKRVEEAARQPDLFVQPTTTEPTQGGL